MLHWPEVKLEKYKELEFNIQWTPVFMRYKKNSSLKYIRKGDPWVAQRFGACLGPGRDPGDPGSNPTSGSRCMEPASPSACVSAPLSLSLCDYHK